MLLNGVNDVTPLTNIVTANSIAITSKVFTVYYLLEDVITFWSTNNITYNLFI